VVATGHEIRAVFDSSPVDLIALYDLPSLWRKRGKPREPFIHSPSELLIKLTDPVRRFLHRATVDPQIPGCEASHHQPGTPVFYEAPSRDSQGCPLTPSHSKGEMSCPTKPIRNGAISWALPS
jgi:hypothetical protein